MDQFEIARALSYNIGRLGEYGTQWRVSLLAQALCTLVSRKGLVKGRMMVLPSDRYSEDDSDVCELVLEYGYTEDGEIYFDIPRILFEDPSWFEEESLIPQELRDQARFCAEMCRLIESEENMANMVKVIIQIHLAQIEAGKMFSLKEMSLLKSLQANVDSNQGDAQISLLSN